MTRSASSAVCSNYNYSVGTRLPAVLQQHNDQTNDDDRIEDGDNDQQKLRNISCPL